MMQLLFSLASSQLATGTDTNRVTRMSIASFRWPVVRIAHKVGCPTCEGLRHTIDASVQEAGHCNGSRVGKSIGCAGPN
jgi:hydrogenase maturation factor